MYKCKICKKQSKKGESMYRRVTKKRSKDKGWEIEEELDCCVKCHSNSNKGEE